MAYTPINWQTGDTITAEKLNRCDNGWGLESTELFSKTVTTTDQGGYISGSLAYTELMTYPTITVTFDGTEYQCSNNSANPDEGDYGAPYNEEMDVIDFSTYPFNLVSYQSGPITITNELATQTAGSHTIVVSAPSVVVSPNFSSAVIGSSTLEIVTGTTTWQEVHDALMAGKYVYTVAEYMDSGDTITSVGHALRTDIQGYEVMLASISSNTSPSLDIFYLHANSADGALS